MYNQNFPKNGIARAGEQRATKQNNQIDSNHVNAKAQRERILKALRKSPLSTLAARRDLDVMHPAARVQELRDRGNQIITEWRHEATERGKTHRVANYVLLKEAGNE